MRKSIQTGIALALIVSAFTGAFSNCLGAIENSWVTKSNMTYSRSGFGAAVVDGKIYAIGGVGTNGFCITTERYDPVADVWTTKASIPTPRSHFGVAVCENKIYCIGGQYIKNYFFRAQSTGITEVYDPATDSWKLLAPMPTPQYSIQANAVNGRIYVMGGYINDTNASNLNQVYDPESNSWSTRTDLPTGVSTYVSAVVGNKIYVFSNNLTQIYDTYYDSWLTGAPAPLPIIMGSAVTTIGKDGSEQICVFGTNIMPWFNSTTKELTTQCYNPETDSWTNGASVPTCRYHAAAANVNETVYVIGGFTTPLSEGHVSYVDCTVNEQYTPLNLQSPTRSAQGDNYTTDYFAAISLLIIIIATSTVIIVYLKRRKQRK